MILKEVAVENMRSIPMAIAAGANRIELNDNLAVGGTTVSAGVMRQAVRYAHQHDVPVVVMIRPRGGDFVYNEDEVAAMLTDIGVAAAAGADAVTFGALTSDGQLDEDVMRRLLTASRGMTVVMHMAFDAIAARTQPQVIDWLVAHGVVRVLTHGGPLTVPIDQTLVHLQQVVRWAHGRIGILPGGGVTSDNVDVITRTLGVSEAHGTKVVAMGANL